MHSSQQGQVTVHQQITRSLMMVMVIITKHHQKLFASVVSHQEVSPGFLCKCDCLAMEVWGNPIFEYQQLSAFYESLLMILYIIALPD